MAVIVYFIVGAVVMKVRYQATGSDLIPNKGFWESLPLLVKVSTQLLSAVVCTIGNVVLTTTINRATLITFDPGWLCVDCKSLLPLGKKEPRIL